MASRPSAAVVQVAVLALWLGAAAFLSLVVAPALFAVLPSRTLAGAVVGRILPAVFYSGIVIGAAVLGLQASGRDSWAWHGREIGAVAMIVACAVAQWIIAPQINRVRAEIGGPIEDLAATDARRVAFGRLHGISVAWLGVAMLAAAVALYVASRDARASGSDMETTITPY